MNRVGGRSPIAGRAVVALMALSMTVATVAVAQPVAPSLSSGAEATGLAVRGASRQVVPPPPPPGLYPAGQCDRLAVGLPGLGGGPYPTVVREIGRSLQGRPIWAEYWGPPRPGSITLVVGQIHGNECSPTLLTEALRRRPLNRSIGIWLIPTMNPDGYAAYSRGNAAGIDLNADGGNRSQPETRALMAFIADIRPALTVHVHSPNGFAGSYASSTGRAAALCGQVASLTALRCGGGAGTRSDRNRWFLWQGHARYGGETLLVELHGVSDAEVPTARPRPATRTVARVRADADTIARLLTGR